MKPKEKSRQNKLAKTTTTASTEATTAATVKDKTEADNYYSFFKRLSL